MHSPVDTAGAIDADGHILEPPDLWEKYLEAKYRDRAIRIKTNAEGLEYFEYNGKPSKLMPAGFPGTLGGMGSADIMPSRERSYVRSAPFGSMDPKERIARLDTEGLAKAVLYPTLGILWEPEVREPEIAAAYTRAYNRWIMDFCADSGGRLVPIAHISLSDPALAATETERALSAGAKGIFFHPFTWTRKYDRRGLLLTSTCTSAPPCQTLYFVSFPSIFNLIRSWKMTSPTFSSLPMG